MSRSFATGAAPKIVAESINGSISVVAGGEGTVTADVTRQGTGMTQAQAEANLSLLEVSFTQDGDTVRIIARVTSRPVAGDAGASFKLTVPAGASLDVHSSNGSITSSGVTGDVRLDTSNGPATSTGGKGVQDVSTSNGAIRIEATDALVTARTSNGGITFSGSLAPGHHSLQTSNGGITIRLPADAQFAVDASTSNGAISSDFAIASTQSSRNRLVGSAGGETGIAIVASTSNGPITLQKQ